MSYASVTAANAPPESEQPKPDPALLDDRDSGHVGEMTSEKADDIEKKGKEELGKAEKKGSELKDKAEKEWSQFEKEAKDLEKKGKGKASEYEKRGRKEWEAHPELYTSLLSAANLAILGTVGLLAYKYWSVPKWDRRIVTATGFGLAAFFGAQGYVGAIEFKKAKSD